MASPGHRHRASLEGFIDLSNPAPIFSSDGQRAQAEQLFGSIIAHFSTTPVSQQHPALRTPFLRVEMVRLMRQYAAAGRSRDLFLSTFFTRMGIDLNTTAAIAQIDLGLLPTKMIEFTDYLLENFFLPLKASSGKTPQSTPANLSIPSGSESHQPLSGSKARLRNLRRDCLIRDKHRCVISRSFDAEEADERLKRDGAEAADDDGRLLEEMNGDDAFRYLQVAHIIPHSLLDTSGNSPLHVARRNALAILEMFDAGVSLLIEGENIDRPTNAITLTADYHFYFGRFKTVFEATEQPHTYRIESVVARAVLSKPRQPITRTLFLSEDRTIDAPLPRLFAIHAAVARILQMSGAGDYCDKVLRDMQELDVSADGDTNLGALVSLRLAGWWNGVAA